MKTSLRLWCLAITSAQALLPRIASAHAGHGSVEHNVVSSSPLWAAAGVIALLAVTAVV